MTIEMKKNQSKEKYVLILGVLMLLMILFLDIKEVAELVRVMLL